MADSDKTDWGRITVTLFITAPLIGGLVWLVVGVITWAILQFFMDKHVAGSYGIIVGFVFGIIVAIVMLNDANKKVPK